MKKIFGYLFAIVLLIIPVIGFAEETSFTPIYKGANTISVQTSESKKLYTSTTADEAALIVEGDQTSTINKCSVNKTGDGDINSGLYGTNAGILVHYGAKLNITSGTINTSSLYADGVIADGTGVINLDGSSINTTGNYSNGLLIMNGANIISSNTDVKTTGDYSPAIKTANSGGVMNITKGTYKTSGANSPVIYAEATNNITKTTLTSDKSTGIDIQGNGAVILDTVTLKTNNTALSDNSDTYKNIYMYRTDADSMSFGNATFSATNSTINTENGDTLFVTNTYATITLTATNINNTNGDLLRIQKSKLGSNGGNVTLNLDNEKVTGNIAVDNSSSLQMVLSNGSVYQGSIDNKNQASNATLELDKDSVIVLTDDTYVDSLVDGDTTNTNIYLNGHKLYVNGTEATGNSGTYTGTMLNSIKTTSTISRTAYFLILAAVLTVIAVAFTFNKVKSNYKK